MVPPTGSTSAFGPVGDGGSGDDRDYRLSRARRLLTAYGVSEILDTVRDLQAARDSSEVLRRIAARAREFLTRDTAAVYIGDPDGDSLKAVAADGLCADQLRGMEVRRGVGILGTVASSGIPEILNDTLADDRGIEVPGTPATEEEEKLMAVPIQSGGRVIGVMAVWRTPGEKSFEARDLAYLEGLAILAEIAIGNARSYEEAQARIGRLSSLAAISRAITTARDPSELLETVYHQMGHLFDTTNFYIATYAQGSDEWSWDLHFEGGVRQAPETHKLGAGMTGYIIKNRVPVLLSSTDEIRHFLAGEGVHAIGELPQSWMGVPLVAGDEITGVMAIQNYRESGLYDQSDLEYFGVIGTEVAVALQNSRLYDAARRDARRLATLNEVSRIVSGELDRGRILRMLCQTLAGSVPFDAFYGAVCPSGPDSFSFPAAYAYGDWTEVGARPAAACPAFAEALAASIPALRGPRTAAGDARSKPRWSGDPERDLAKAIRHGSCVTLPLYAGDEPLGVLAFLSRHRNAFAHDHVELLAGAARQTAIALGNARSFEAAQSARAEAEAANHMKSAFLAKMSHELRTPLNAIINFAYLLNSGTEGDVNVEQSEMLSRVEEAGRHLLGLINDILDLAKIEAGRMELSLEDTDLNALIAEVLHTAAALVKDKAVKLGFSPGPASPLVRADRVRVRQVLLNLLSNAAKFTDSGSIDVLVDDTGCAADGTAGASDYVAVAVRDTGTGMSTDSLSRIFLEFVQGDDSDARRAGGTGLGLPISRHFVEMHGGTIRVESARGVGSTFSFTLPRSPVPVAEAGRGAEDHGSMAAPGHDGAHARVLIIDDDPDSRKFLSRCLSRAEYDVTTLRDSRASLQTARSEKPDVVVLDVMMPDADGWGVLRSLKADPDTSRIPVVMCSVLSEQERALYLDASDYLLKPLDPEALKAMARKYAPDGGTVLAIDDDPNSLEIIRRILASTPVDVRTAGDGAAGLAEVGREKPDVIVLDLMMPGMDGFEVLSRLRADPATADVPVVVVTAKDLNAAERATLKTHAAALLQKGSFKPEDLERVVYRILSREKAGKA